MMQGYARTVSHSLMKGVGLMELVFLVISLVVLWKIFSDAKKITVPPARCTVI